MHQIYVALVGFTLIAILVARSNGLLLDLEMNVPFVMMVLIGCLIPTAIIVVLRVRRDEEGGQGDEDGDEASEGRHAG